MRLPTVIQSSAEVEHELLSLSSDSWTDAQQPKPCTPTVTQDFAEHVCLPTDRGNWRDKDFADPIDPIEAIPVGGELPRALRQQRWSPVNVPLLWAAARDDDTNPVLKWLGERAQGMSLSMEGRRNQAKR